jgi:RHS repeat-associated protein
VGQVVGAGDGSLAARYEYDGFGQAVLAEGDFAGENPYRFSTKFFDIETSLYYYGYRYYSAELGRWINRDPIGRKGGINLYGFVRNNSISAYDLFGLAEPEFGAAFNISIGYGRKGLYINSLSFVGSATQGLCDDLKIKGDFNIRFYTGDVLGAPSDGSGFGYDITGTIAGMLGKGSADSTPSYSLNHYTKSAIGNTYRNSFAWGQSFNYNSNVGGTNNGFIGLRADDFFAHYSNDVGEFPTYGGPTDYAWTAGAIVGIYTGGGEYAELGFQDFTGRYIDRSITDPISGRQHYRQNPDQRILNNAEWYFRYGNMDSGSITAHIESPEWLNGQHIVHDTRNIARFLYPEERDDVLEFSLSIEGIVEAQSEKSK